MKSTYKVRIAIAYKANLIAIFVNISLFLASRTTTGGSALNTPAMFQRGFFSSKS